MAMFHHTDAARGLQAQPASSPSQATHLARVGHTRCYWALLSSELEFVFLDPVLAHHLGSQKDVFVGKSLLEFVHPDEQNSAANDLKGVLDSRTLHGSVTRVRYCRLSKIRKLLGFSGTPDIPSVMRPVFYDESYMACDLVINLAADGLVLCFIHAVIDIRPEDNDEHARTHWTNWCGTSSGGISPELAAFLPRQLERVCPPLVGAPCDRVFQLLDNNTERTVLFSWPPIAPREDYGRLARDIQMQFTSPDNGTPPPSDAAAKTSCTRRYKAQQWMMFGDSFEREIESIFIPYGCIIFACHKTIQTRPLQTYPQNPLQQQQQQQYFFDHPQQQPFSNGGFMNGGIENWGSGPYLPPSAQAQAASQWVPSQQLPTAVLPAPPPASTDDGAESPSQSTSSGEAPAPAKGKRAGGNPPAGVTKCSHCKIKTSPEWRKGPSGKKDLCNACGLRYARSRAKKEGHPIQRRKKDRSSAGDGAGSSASRAKKAGSPKVEQQQQPQQWIDPTAAIMAFAAQQQQQQSFEQQPAYAFHQQPQQQMFGQPQQFAHGHDALNLLSSASFERAAEQEKAAHDKSPGPPVYVQ